MAINRCVQFVHCMMHKCIMVKVAGNEKHVKYVKTRKFNEIIDKFTKVGGNRIFSGRGGEI